MGANKMSMTNPTILKFPSEHPMSLELIHRVDDMQAEVRWQGQVIHLDACTFGPLAKALVECEKRQKENNHE